MPQRKSKKILIYIFLFLIIGTYNNKNLNISILKIKNVNVSGLEEEINNELSNKLNFIKLHNLFLLDKLKITHTIDQNNLIEKYSIFKRYTASLDIQLHKTQFLAKVKKNNETYFFGSNGKMIKKNSIQNDLPFIFGDFKSKNFFELKKAIDQSNFEYNQIENLLFFKSGRWDIETKSGLLIKLPKNNLEKSFETIIEIINQNPFEEINKIDLRQLNQIIIDGR